MRYLLALALMVGALGCGTPPNQRLLTRTSDYHKAMSYGFDTGHPFDIEELERKIPELKGKVVTAPQWIDEYEQMVKAAEARGESVYEYKIPYAANITIEVVGEPNLTRSYTVPPTGFVNYPYLKKVTLVGLKPDELQERLERGLAKYLKKPEVLIHINQSPSYVAGPSGFLAPQPFGSGEIIVTGLSGGRMLSNYAWTGRETLVSVLGSNLPPQAEWRQIRVIRRDKNDPLHKSRVIVADLWDYFSKADVRQDIPLFPGDVVFVPMRWSTDDQFWEDFGYFQKVLNVAFFADNLKEAIKEGGTLRN